jgi:hypothetical protein
VPRTWLLQPAKTIAAPSNAISLLVMDIPPSAGFY